MKLLIITSWVLRLIDNVKSKIRGKKLNSRNNLNSGEMNNFKNLWLKSCEKSVKQMTSAKSRLSIFFAQKLFLYYFVVIACKVSKQ